MSESKVFYLDEVRDKLRDVKKKFVDGKDYDLIYDVIKCLIKGGMPKDSVLGYLDNMAVLCDPFTMTQDTRDLMIKAVEICSKDEKEISLAQDVRDFVMSTDGYFLSTDVHKCLQLSTRRDKKTASQYLSRLVEGGVIERYGKRNGQFRLINKDLEVIDWKKDPGQELDLSLPLHLNDLVKIYPKNMIVIAGMSNAGKTALLLNIVAENIDRFRNNINYFSSEMGACELRVRLKKFELPDEVWDGCRFVERSDDFSDVIGPDKINIIDYFEINDSFWQIGGDFKRINDKLEKGIAIIALQKHPEKDEGSGGRFSKEKPRLYLALNEIGDYNELKIVKGKNWRDQDINPNGLIKNFKIRDGYQLIELGNWHRRE